MPDIFIPGDKKEENKEKPQEFEAASSDLKFPEDEKHSHSLSSFCRNPKGFSFRDQDEDEKILLFLRKHFITNFTWIFITIILITIPPFLLFIPFLRETFLSSVPFNFLVVSVIFYYLIVFSFAFVSFATWFYNISIVTNKRIVDVDFSDLIYHDVAVTKLRLVEDTNYTKIGFLHSLFNYGNVFVQTAGEQAHFDFLAIPKPEDAVNIIEDLIGIHPK